MKTTLPLSLLCAAALTLTACGRDQEGQPNRQMPPPEVGVVTVQPQDVPLERSLVGRLAAYRSADVRARVAGVVLKRAYTEGSEVKAGQLMFLIDPAPYEASLKGALANLAAAKASYANAHVIAERDRSLAPQGYISRAQLDTDEATERSEAAAVKQAQASVQTARVNLGYTRVVSPIDGRASEQQVTVGALVGNSTSDTGAGSTLLATVQQIDPLYLNFTISAAELNQLQAAQKSGGVTLSSQDQSHVQITLPDGNRYGPQGTLDYTSPSVDPSTGAVNMRAIVPNPDHLLLPGMYADLKVDLGQRTHVFLVPQQAVQRDPAGAYVLVVGADGKVARKAVSVGDMRGGDWIVSGGLQGGDRVIVSGVQNARPGEPAKASPWQPQTPAAAAAPSGAGHQS